MKKRSVNILGHQTSVSLEEPFWEALRHEAETQCLSLNALIARIDEARVKDAGYNLSSTLRLYVLQRLQERLSSSISH